MVGIAAGVAAGAGTEPRSGPCTVGGSEDAKIVSLMEIWEQLELDFHVFGNLS